MTSIDQILTAVPDLDDGGREQLLAAVLDVEANRTDVEDGWLPTWPQELGDVGASVSVSARTGAVTTITAGGWPLIEVGPHTDQRPAWHPNPAKYTAEQVQAAEAWALAAHEQIVSTLDKDGVNTPSVTIR